MEPRVVSFGCRNFKIVEKRREVASCATTYFSYNIFKNEIHGYVLILNWALGFESMPDNIFVLVSRPFYECLGTS